MAISRIFSVDVGGTGIKAALLDPSGRFLSEKFRLKTPPIGSPAKLVQIFDQLAKDVSPFDVMSVGFPGLLQKGVIRSCPTLKTKSLLGVNLEKKLHVHFGVPVKVRNDAEVQALPVIRGRGIEVVLTLGTGFGFAFFQDGHASHLEMSTHPLAHGETYNERLGDRALKRLGKKKWLKHVRYALEVVETLTHHNHLYIGGGNAVHLKGMLPKSVKLISNDYGIVGGAWLWRLPKDDQHKLVD